jgi:RND superfamily putative drug exporter
MLVPATMYLVGRANWWLPRALDRELPHLAPEPAEPAAPAAPVPVRAIVDYSASWSVRQARYTAIAAR